jgi:hypothetical protein
VEQNPFRKRNQLVLNDVGVENKMKLFGDEIYKKVGKRYEQIGHEFRGFPTDGIWLVQDGKCSMTCLIGAKERVPIFALNYRLHEEELCKHIQSHLNEGSMSLMDEIRLCCDYFARVAENPGLSAKVDNITDK